MLVSTLNPLPVSCCSWQHGCRGGPRPFARGLLPTAALRHSSASLPLPPLPSAGGKGLCRLPPARATEDDRCLDRPTDGWSEAQAEKVHVSGLTVSPNGFFALLSPDLCSIQSLTPLLMSGLKDSNTSLEAAFQDHCLTLAVQITSGGVDQQKAESIESLTLLQLLQGIDVAVRLPYEALMQACPGIPDGNILERVVIHGIPLMPQDMGEREAPGFSASLVVMGRSFGCSDPFTVIALALRYHAPILVLREMLQTQALSPRRVRELFPDALPAEESTRQANTITHNISVAWRAAATPIGDNDLAQLRRQLGTHDQR